jgi:hypothetical protein
MCEEKNIKSLKNTLFLGMKFSELIRQNTMWKGTKVLLLLLLLLPL